MIKIEYIQKPYNYGNVGGQPYEIKTTMDLDSDISATEALIAFARLLSIATYHISADTLRKAADELEENGYL